MTHNLRRVVLAVLRRLLLLAVLLVVTFCAVEALPGDGATASADRRATAAEVQAQRVRLGLDRSIPDRLAARLAGFARFDLGTSLNGEQVGPLVWGRFRHTLVLGALALVASAAAAVTLGVAAATREGRARDRHISRLSVALLGLPEFVIATALVLVLALWLGLLPAVTLTRPGGEIVSPLMLVLPALALAVPQAGWNTRIVRAAYLDAARAPHVEAARLDGLTERRVALRHVVPGALPTVAASLATSSVSVLGGALVVETIFNYPGVGTLLAGAVENRDVALVTGVVALVGAVMSLVFLLADSVRDAAAGGRR